LSLVVKIGSEVTGALTGIKQVEGGLGKLPAAAARASAGLSTVTTAARTASVSMVAMAATVSAVLLPLAAFAAVGFAVSKVSAYFSSLKEKAKEAKEEIEKTRKGIEQIFSAVGKEAAETSGLIAILKSETETRERKLAAIKQLKNIQPEIFGQLKLEGYTVIGLDNAYKQYLDNLQTVVAAKIKQAQLEQIITRILTLQGATLTQSQKDQVSILQKINKELGLGPTPLTLKARNKREDELNELLKNRVALENELSELSKGIKTKPFKDQEVQKIEIEPVIKLGKKYRSACNG